MSKFCSQCGIEKLNTEFYKSNVACNLCVSARKKRYYQKNKERVRQQGIIYRAKNLEKVKASKKRHYEENKDDILQKQKQYQSTRKEARAIYIKQYHLKNREADLQRSKEHYQNNRERYKEHQKLWKENNPERHRATSRATYARYRAAKLQRTPFWSEYEEIIEFYENCPDGMEVDHIIPLQGDEYGVCGLHVLGNLQYLTREENRRKSNKFYPEEHFWVKEYLKAA